MAVRAWLGLVADYAAAVRGSFSTWVRRGPSSRVAAVAVLVIVAGIGVLLFDSGGGDGQDLRRVDDVASGPTTSGDGGAAGDGRGSDAGTPDPAGEADLDLDPASAESEATDGGAEGPGSVLPANRDGDDATADDGSPSGEPAGRDTTTSTDTSSPPSSGSTSSSTTTTSEPPAAEDGNLLTNLVDAIIDLL